MQAMCTDPYAVQTEARRAHALLMVGQGGSHHDAACGILVDRRATGVSRVLKIFGGIGFPITNE